MPLLYNVEKKGGECLICKVNSAWRKAAKKQKENTNNKVLKSGENDMRNTSVNWSWPCYF